MPETWSPLIVAFALAILHFLAGKLKFLDVIPRSRWLSGAAGVSIAYVFVHLLPDLAERQQAFESLSGFLRSMDKHVWVIALGGLAIFYALERAVRRSRKNGGDGSARQKESRSQSTGVFYMHLAFYALYNMTIGYLLEDFASAPKNSVWVFGLAMGLHFLVVDYGLHKRFAENYRRFGRQLLALAVLGGAVVRLVVTLADPAVAAMLAFLAGGIVFNVLKEELPEERQSRLWPFLVGSISYTILLLIT